jgi:hypothetical protein
MTKSYGLVASAAAALMCVLPLPAAEAKGSVTVRTAQAYRPPVVTRSVTTTVRGPVIVNRSHGRVHRRHGPGLFIAAPVVIGSCAALRIKAVDTGSRYWWRRYRECRGWE